MTLVTLPGVEGAGVEFYGRELPSFAIGQLREDARYHAAWSAAVLAADDADFRVETYLGTHAQRERMVIQEGSATNG